MDDHEIITKANIKIKEEMHTITLTCKVGTRGIIVEKNKTAAGKTQRGNTKMYKRQHARTVMSKKRSNQMETQLCRCSIFLLF